MHRMVFVSLVLALATTIAVEADQEPGARRARPTAAASAVAAAAVADMDAHMSALNAQVAAFSAHFDVIGARLAGIAAQAADLPFAALFPNTAHLPRSFAPQDPADSLWRSGRALLSRGDYPEAAAAFRRIRTEQRFSGSAYRAGSYYWEAFALSRSGSRGELQTARELLAAMKQRYPEDQQIRDADALDATIASRLAQSGDNRAAQDVARRAAGGAQCPNEDEDVRLVALNGLLQMDADQALPILREVLAQRDECSAPLRRQAIFLLAQKRVDQVDRLILDIARNDPDPEVRQHAVFWLSRVNTPEALSALEEILRSSSDRKVQENALFALSRNRTDRATELLRSYASRQDVPSDLRRNAIFWLGQRRRPEDLQFLRELFSQTTDTEARQHIIMAIAQSRDETAGDWLLDIALRDGEDPEVRRQALFFAAQKRVVSTERLVTLYDQASGREMKEQVLFALSQRLREPSVVDALMDIGRRETDPELRRNVIFWLSRSRDPRVAQYLLEIIRR